MPRNVAVAHVELLADDHGVWCPRCLLPSGLRRFFAITIGSIIYVADGAVCVDCDRRL